MKSKKRLKMHVAINLQFPILIFSNPAIPTTVLSKRKRERKKKRNHPQRHEDHLSPSVTSLTSDISLFLQI